MKQSSRISRLAALVAAAAAITLGLTGCNGFFTAVNNNPGGGSGTSFVYVTNTGGTLSAYSIASGVLTALSGSPYTLPLAPTSIAVAPNGSFLYVGTNTGVFLYTIGSDGTLTEANNDTIVYINKQGLVPVSMTMDPKSSWLIMAYQGSATVEAVSIDPTTGLLATADPFPVTSTFSTTSPELTISPAGSNVFVALGTGGVEAFGFNASATGAAGPWGTAFSIPLAGGKGSDNAVAVDTTSTYLYIGEADLTTAASPGMLRMVKIATLNKDLVDIATGVGPSAVLADLTGAYVYVANGTDGTISGYTVDTTNTTLTSMGDAYPSEKSSIGLVEDSSKSYVLNAGSGANPNLWLYTFDSSTTGVLDVSATKSTATTNPSGANGIAIITP